MCLQTTGFLSMPQTWLVRSASETSCKQLSDLEFSLLCLLHYRFLLVMQIFASIAPLWRSLSWPCNLTSIQYSITQFTSSVEHSSQWDVCIAHYVFDNNNSGSPPGMYALREWGLYINPDFSPPPAHSKCFSNTGWGMDEWMERWMDSWMNSSFHWSMVGSNIF